MHSERYFIKLSGSKNPTRHTVCRPLVYIEVKEYALLVNPINPSGTILSLNIGIKSFFTITKVAGIESLSLIILTCQEIRLNQTFL